MELKEVYVVYFNGKIKEFSDYDKAMSFGKLYNCVVFTKVYEYPILRNKYKFI